MQATPFKLINDGEWAHIRKAGTAIVQAWCGHWLTQAMVPAVEFSDASVPLPNGGAQCDPEAEALSGAPVSKVAVAMALRLQRPGISTAEPAFAGGRWQTYAAGAQDVLHIETSMSMLEALAVANFGDCVNRLDPSCAGVSELFQSVFEAALRDLACRFAQEAGMPCADLLEAPSGAGAAATMSWRRGEAAVHMRWPMCAAHMHIVLSGEVVRQLIGPAPVDSSTTTALIPLWDCVRDRTVSLRAWAGEAQIGLGELHELAPGDVIPLEARPDESFRITIDGVTTGAHAYLGSAAGSRALRLISTTAYEEQGK